MLGTPLIKKCLAFGIIFLFLGTWGIPSLQSTPFTITMGRPNNTPIVYVDDDYNPSTPGWGVNHFNTIQKGIDAVEDTGTVFVYNGTYSENIIVNNSLSLLGENTAFTLVDGMNHDGNGINISADNVTISCLTIQNYIAGYGISISHNNISITNTVISGNMVGIQVYYDDPYEPASSDKGYNTIENNLIVHNEAAGIDLNGHNNTIVGNYIAQSQFGIILVGGGSNIISLNNISDNENGIFNTISYHTVIYRNIISRNVILGVSNFCTSLTFIRQNNFIRNGQNGYFNEPIQTRYQLLKIILDFPLQRSIWEQNYWDKSQTLPYIIPGLVSYQRGPTIEPPFIHNFFQLDWHPTQEPHDIPNIS